MGQPRAISIIDFASARDNLSDYQPESSSKQAGTSKNAPPRSLYNSPSRTHLMQSQSANNSSFTLVSNFSRPTSSNGFQGSTRSRSSSLMLEGFSRTDPNNAARSRSSTLSLRQQNSRFSPLGFFDDKSPASEITLVDLQPVRSKDELSHHDDRSSFEHASDDAKSVDEKQDLKIPLAREIPFILVIALSHFMTQAALGQALAPTAAISSTFGTKDAGEISWFIAGYSLTVGTFILISGRIGDIIGHKRVFCSGYIWLAMWSGFCGFAAYTDSMIFFDFCRAMQGIGPALLMPNGLALYAKAYSGLKKNLLFSLFGMLAPAGFVAGAFSGSLFGEYVWWPWAFWTYALASLGLCAISLVAIPRRLGATLPNRPTFDYPGAIVGVLALVLINLSFNQAPQYGWGSPHVYVLLIVGLLVLAIFFLVERQVKDPLLPTELLDSTVAFVLGCVGMGWASFGIWLFYSYRFLMEVRGLSPLQVTIQFIPCAVSGVFASGLTGFMMTHTPVSFIMVVSMCAFFVGIIVGGTAQVHQSYWAQTFVSCAIMPFGMDMSFPAASLILSSHFPSKHQGLAMSLVNTVVNYGISIALGIAGTVEVYRKDFRTDPDSNLLGIRSALYSAMALSGAAILCGTVYFLKSLRRDGWKIEGH